MATSPRSSLALSNHIPHQSPQNGKKSKAEILEVKRKAISLLTTAYKTDSDEQVQELENQLKDLLLMIRPEDVQGAAKDESDTTTTKKEPTRTMSSSRISSKTSAPAGVILRDFNGRKHNDLDPKLESRVGEIKKPMKQFHAQTGVKDEILLQKGMVAGMQQEAFLAAAMGRKQENTGGWMGYLLGTTNEEDDLSETGFKEFGEMGGKGLRRHAKKQLSPHNHNHNHNNNSNRRRKRPSAGNSSLSDAFAGMTIVTTKGVGTNKSTASSISSGSFDSEEDDVSTLGTEPTYESMSERMTGFLRVRRLPTTAEEEDDTNNDDENSEETLPLQDIAEEETNATPATNAEAPTWRGWFLRGRGGGGQQEVPTEAGEKESRSDGTPKCILPPPPTLEAKAPPTTAFATPIHTQ